MNAAPKHCDLQRIDAYLQADPAGPGDEGLIEHLDSCLDCRSSLEDRAAQRESWESASVLLRPTPFDQAADPSFSAARILVGARELPREVQAVLEALVPSEDPDRLGRMGPYEITGVIGSGGMGVVLKAIDPSLDRVVALKVLSPHLAYSDSARRRFAREAKAAAAVLHPNVIPIHCVSSDAAVPYLVMTYVRGGSLQARLDAEGPLAPIEILRIGSEIAAGLAAAHEQGLVHRDIKPANILLEEGVERVTLTDFGLARAVDDASLTREGAVAGTPQYMSPEQARGEAVDQRSDLFSLGSVLYALCTGQPPFRAESSYGVMRQIIDSEPSPIRELNPEVPDWLSRIVERLMSKDAGARFECASEVRALLEQCLSHLQQPAIAPLPALLRDDSRTTSLRTPTRQWIGVLMILSVLGSAVLGFTLWQGLWDGQGPNSARPGASDLHEAVASGSIEQVRQLLAEGAAVDAQDQTGQTPLQSAALLRRREMVELLVSSGADLHHEVLHAAAEGGDAQILASLLSKGGDIHQNEGMGSPIRRAAWAGQVEAVRLLLERGAKADANEVVGRTALRYAAWGSWRHEAAAREIAEMLLNAGADPNSVANDGFTPIHEAAIRDSEKLLLVLIEAGGKVNQRVRGESKWDGLTAVDLAMKYEHLGMVAFLRTHGALSGEELVARDLKVQEQADSTPPTWASLGLEEVPADYPTDAIALIQGLMAARGQWIFAGITLGSDQQKATGREIEGRMSLTGEFKNALALEKFPIWPLGVQWSMEGEKYASNFLIFTMPGAEGIELMLMRPPTTLEGTEPEERGDLFDGHWDLATRTVTWTHEVRLPEREEAGSPSDAEDAGGAEGAEKGEVEGVESFEMHFAADGRITLRGYRNPGVGPLPLIEGAARIRVGEAPSHKELELTTLPGGYRVFFASQSEVSLLNAEAEAVAGARVDLLGIEGELIYGRVAKYRGGGAGVALPGYFVVNTRTGDAVRGLTLSAWEELLRAKGVKEAKMLPPESYGPRY